MFFPTEHKKVKSNRQNIRLPSDFSKTEFNATNSGDTFRVQKNEINLIMWLLHL